MKHFICDCPEGYILPINQSCTICKAKEVIGKPKGYWHNKERDKEFFVLRQEGFKTREISQMKGYTLAVIRAGIRRCKDHYEA